MDSMTCNISGMLQSRRDADSCSIIPWKRATEVVIVFYHMMQRKTILMYIAVAG